MNFSEADRYERLLRAFEELCDLTAAEQHSEISRLGVEDPPFADELAQLLGLDMRDHATGHSDDMLREMANRIWADDMPEGRAEGGFDLPRELGGYTLIQQLGSGGSGTVFRAIDSDGRQVALKVLDTSILNNRRAVARFRREFRAVSRLDHPHCVKVFSEGQEAAQRYFTMEYVGGGELGGLTNAPLKILLPVFIQITSALAYIHSKRIVHRDLKPANILLTSMDPVQVKLADFGIALDAKEDRLTKTNGVIGTLDFLSPEQIMGEAIDSRSDLFSLGCVMWQLLTGNPAFEGTRLLRSIARVEAFERSIKDIRPDLPESLDQLLSSLLAPKADERPHSAVAVAHALANIHRELDPSATLCLSDGGFSELQQGFVFQPGRVGRREELSRCMNYAQAAFRADETAPIGIIVRAKAGMGKTTFIRALLKQLGSDNPVIFGADRRTLGSSGQALEYIALQASKWTSADRQLPNLDLWAEGTIGPNTNPGDVARRRVYRLAERLMLISQSRKVLIHVEDLHEAKASEAVMLHDLIVELSRYHGRRPFMVLSTRIHADDIEPSLCKQIELRPLTNPQLAELTCNMLGFEPSSGDASSIIGRVNKRAAGSPFVAQAYIHSLVNQGEIYLASDGWKLRHVEVDSLTSEQVLTDGISQETLSILCVAAVAGKRFDSDLLEQVCQVSESETLDALHEGIRAELIKVHLDDSGLDLYVFTHDEYQTALYNLLSQNERDDVHLKVGASLQSRPNTSAAMLAEHFVHSSDETVAFHYLTKAADAAIRSYNFDDALDFLNQASLRTRGESESAIAELLEQRADAMVVVGQAAQAVPLFERLLTGGVSSLQQVRVYRKLGQAKLRADDFVGGLAALRRALRVAGVTFIRGRWGRFLQMVRDHIAASLRHKFRLKPVPNDMLQQVALVHSELMFAYRWVNAELCAAHAAAYRRAAERLGEPSLLSESLTMFSNVLSYSGQPKRAIPLQKRAHALASAEGDYSNLAMISGLEGTGELVRDNPSGAVALLRKAETRARKAGDPFLIGMSMAARAWAHLHSGEWTLAERTFMDSAQMANQQNISWMAADALAGQGYVHAFQGRHEQAIECAIKVENLARKIQINVYEAVAAEIRGWSAFFLEQPLRSAREFRRAHAYYEAHQLGRVWGYTTNLASAEALLRACDQGFLEVEELLVELSRLAKFVRWQLWGISMHRGVSDFIEGLMASRKGQRQRALRFFAKTRRLRVGGDMPWDGYILARMALECHRLGEVREVTLEYAQQAVKIVEKTDVPGLMPLLIEARNEICNS